MIANSAAMQDALDRTGPHDAVYERLSLFGIAGLCHAKSKGIPLILEVNAPLWEEAARYRSLFLADTARAMAREVMAGADIVLVVSEQLRRRLLAEGVDPGKLHVVPNGVDRDLFSRAEPAARPRALRGRNLLVFIGSLKPWHGIEFLLEAFTHCCKEQSLGLWVVGDGPLRDRVERAVLAQPQDIVYEKAVSHERVPQILKAADAAVAPYPKSAPDYFCPLKVVEALAAGRPLIASRTACVTDLVEDAAGVELFTPGDEQDFARAVARALADRKRTPDPRMQERLSWSSRAAEVLGLVSKACVHGG